MILTTAEQKLDSELDAYNQPSSLHFVWIMHACENHILQSVNGLFLVIIIVAKTPIWPLQQNMTMVRMETDGNGWTSNTLQMETQNA